MLRLIISFYTKNIVKVDSKMIERYRRKWNFIHPYRLSNRAIPRHFNQQTATESNSNSSTSNIRNVTSNEVKNSDEMKLSSIEAAKLRFLQRKSEKK